MESTEKPFYCDVKGDGRPLLFIHGFGASTFTWRYLVRSLSERYTTVAVDLKGFGKSPKPFNTEYTVADQMRGVRDVVFRLNLKDFTIIAHSYGAVVALALALDLTDSGRPYLRDLVLLSGAVYPLTLPRFVKMFRTPAAGNIGLGNISRESQVRAVLETCFHDSSRITDDIVSNYSTPLYEKGASSALAQVAARIALPDAEKYYLRYKDIYLPAQLIWGRHDTVVPLDTAHKLNRDVQNSRLTIIDDCGHIPQEEKPVETLHVITSFLDRAND
jgi:pimeloyl-ACP methyl ester carboxylesterase